MILERRKAVKRRPRLYSSIEIAGYRGFDSFKLSGLGRVNLLVGTNNSGKTSVLECIEFLQSGGSPSVLRSILTRRGELEPWSAGGRVIPAVKHLFTDHDVVGKRVTIAGAVRDGTKGFGRRVTMYALAAEGDELRPNGDDDPDDGELGEMTPYSLHVESPSLIEPFKTKMTSDGLLPEFRYVRPAQSMLPTALFLRTEGMTVSDVGRYFAEVVLTEREEHVVKALRVVEPAIERIAPVAFELPQLAGRSQFRSGAWGMGCGGCLASHWLLRTRQAASCWSMTGDVTIQRIDQARDEGIRFGKEAIVAASERGLEVR